RGRSWWSRRRRPRDCSRPGPGAPSRPASVRQVPRPGRRGGSDHSCRTPCLVETYVTLRRRVPVARRASVQACGMVCAPRVRQASHCVVRFPASPRERSMRLHRSALGYAIALAFAATFPAQAEVFVNEIHYDNIGTDVGEAIEVVGSAGESLAGYQVVLYNGSNGQSYRTDTLPEGNPATCGGQVRFAVVDYPQDGLQNGAPDGIALIDPQGGVVQFLSYEGTMTAMNGPAAGMTSTDIGVEQANNTPIGLSLQLGGEGNVYGDFAWAVSATATFGTCNNDQSFGEPGNAAPRVVDTFPAQGSSDFPYAAPLTVTFSEPVTARPGAFTLDCGDLPRRRP